MKENGSGFYVIKKSNTWQCQYAALRAAQVEYGKDDIVANTKRLAFFNKLLKTNVAMVQKHQVTNYSATMAKCRKVRGCGNRRRCYAPLKATQRAKKNESLTKRYITWVKRTQARRQKYVARDVKYLAHYQKKCDKMRS